MKKQIYRFTRALIPLLLYGASSSCSLRKPSTFRVIPHTPSYLLRAPDARETPFPEILHNYNGFEPGRRWIDLQPWMEIRIENAYYETGASRLGLKGFLGTETATYLVTARGLNLVSFQSMSGRPVNDLPVQRLISPAQAKHRYHRFYFEIFFKGQNSNRSLLLGSDSMQKLDRLSRDLTDPEKVCGRNSSGCTLFPEACSVSMEMRIVVNGKSQTVLWGAILANLINIEPHHVELKRFYAGQLTPVEIDAQDPGDLQLPLLPGDHVLWR